jgi:hypothetical protein
LANNDGRWNQYPKARKENQIKPRCQDPRFHLKMSPFSDNFNVASRNAILESKKNYTLHYVD